MLRKRIYLLILVMLVATPVLPQEGEEEPRPTKKLRAWPLIYIDETAEGQRRIDMFFSAIGISNGPLGRSLRIAPFYWSKQSASGDRAWTLFLPVYYYQRDPTLWRFYSLLLAMGRLQDGSERWWKMPPLLPLYSGESTETFTKKRAGVWPLFNLYAHSRTESDSVLDFLVLAPWGEPGQSGLPLFRHHVDAAGHIKNAVFLPFYIYSAPHGAAGNRFLALPLLGWARSSDESRTWDFFLLALGDYKREGESYDWHALLGIFGGGRQLDESWLRLEPFYSTREKQGEGSFSVLHLYGREWNEAEGRVATNVLWPLGRFEEWQNGAYKRRLAPFYFSASDEDSSYFVLAPLYFHSSKGESSRRMVFPLYYESLSEEKGLRVAFPFYWQSWNSTHQELNIFPFYSDLRSPEERVQFFLGPLYMRRELQGEPPLQSDSVLWPLFQYRRQGENWHLHALPLLWLTREQDTSFHLVAPLYLYAAGPDFAHHWLIPLWGKYQRGREDGSTLERSFYGGGAVVQSQVKDAQGKRMSESLHVFGPLAGYTRDYSQDSSHSRLLPFWWQSRSPEKSLTLIGGNLWVDWNKAGARERGVLWPLTRHWKRGDQHGFNFLELVSTQHGPEDQSQIRISPLTYYRDNAAEPSWQEWFHLLSLQRGDDWRRVRIMPFLYSEETRGDASTRNAFFWLYGRHRSEEVTEDRLLPFWWKKSSPLKSFTLIGGNLWVDSKTPESRERGVLWPLTRYWEQGERHGFQALALYSSERGPGQSKLRLTPFTYLSEGAKKPSLGRWWHLFSLESGEDWRSLQIMPFLYSEEIRKDSSTHNAFFWLYGRHRSAELREDRLLPFYYYRREGPEENPSKEFEAVFPFYFRSESDQGDARSLGILPPFYYQESRDSANFLRRWHPWPLAYTERQGKNRSGMFFPLTSYRLAPEEEVGNLWT
ncbi:MAG: hypothetical protein V3T77_08630, partial [Planctomycetota bacterium]